MDLLVRFVDGGIDMKAWKHGVRLAVMLAVCVLLVACPEPGSDLDGLGNEFEVVLGLPQDSGATDRAAFTINNDPDVTHVYAKVFNSTREHLPSIHESGVTELIKDEAAGKWSVTVRLASPTSGTITFFVWGENFSGEHLYSGDGNLTVGTNNNSITVTTGAGYSLRDMGPGGGYIFYDKGSYGEDGWRYLEAARAGWSGSTSDPGYIFGHYMPDGSTNTTMGTTTGVGTGEENTLALVSSMQNAAYNYTYGGGTTANYAAKICYDHVTGGYDDWFLPSKDELTLMYQNLVATYGLGRFSVLEAYWSSSEDYTDPAQAIRYAWALYIKDDGTAVYYPGTYRQNSLKVRPVRDF
jgi:hypothetical protein